ncbi:hypothetical protein [Bacillus shivajii]|nr:hypothetical protein [Bacillus shivajii]
MGMNELTSQFDIGFTLGLLGMFLLVVARGMEDILANRRKMGIFH